MSDIAVRVEGLSKQYRIGKRDRYRTLRGALNETVAAPFRRLRSMLPLFVLLAIITAMAVGLWLSTLNVLVS